MLQFTSSTELMLAALTASNFFLLTLLNPKFSKTKSIAASC